LDSVEDLKITLYRLNFLKYPDYRKAKENLDKSIVVEEDIEKERSVKFDN
jgi:hypothetical protein